MAAPIIGGILVADEVIDIFIPVLFYFDRCRRRRLEPVRLEPESDPPAAPGPPLAPETLVSEDLLAALERLSPAHRLLILLRDIEGLSYREIAEALGCPLGSVMSGLHNARTRRYGAP
jgi:RNA polymerase sigma factor (sigma-70 family)